VDLAPPPHCAPLSPATRDALVRMLGELRVSVSGLVSPALHRALADAGAAGDPHVVALVATVGGEPAGFVVATRDAPAFWRRALLRRPATLARVVATRLLARLPRPARAHAAPTPSEADALPDARLAPRRWTDPDDASAARIVFVGVRPAFRGRGVGESLYRAFFDAAAARGAALVLARIARDNQPSIRLHRAAGWDLYRDSDGVLAVRVLDTA
jgi:ribosomal protein S18 acetylase RimI-like enzyme